MTIKLSELKSQEQTGSQPSQPQTGSQPSQPQQIIKLSELKAQEASFTPTVQNAPDIKASPTPSPQQAKPIGLFESLGAEVTPQMEKQAPFLSATAKTAQEFSAAPIEFINQLLLNTPRAFLKEKGIDLPRAKTLSGKTLQLGAGLAGGAKNPLIKALGVGASGTSIPKSIAQGAALGAAQTPTNEPLDIKERGKQAIVGATLGAVGEVAIKGFKSVPKFTANRSRKLINSLIKPLKRHLAYGKNPGGEIAKQKLVANNLDDLQAKIIERKNEIGGKIDQVLTSGKNDIKKLDISSATKPIDIAMKEAAKQNNQTLINRLVEVKKAITNKLEIGINELSGLPIIEDKGLINLSNMSPLEATKVKRLVGSLSKFSGNPSDDNIANNALQRAYRVIRGNLERKVPEIKAVNESYANLLSAEQAVKNRAAISERHGVSLLDISIGSSAAITSSLLKAPLSIGVLAAIGSAAIFKGTKSTAFKTRLTKFLTNIGDSELNNLFISNPEIRGVLLDVFRKSKASQSQAIVEKIERFI